MFVSGQLALVPGEKELSGGSIEEQTEQVFGNLRAILEEAGTGLDRLVKTTVFLQGLGDFQGMNGVYAKHVGERRRRARRSRWRSSLRRPRGDRSDRARVVNVPAARNENRQVRRSRSTSGRSAWTRTSSEAPSATNCSASTRRTPTSSCRASTPRASNGARVARPRRGARRGGRLVGVRLHPSDRRVHELAPAGIEFAPPRDEVSTGPGRHDFEIVADPALSVEDDMRRRDFTVNAMARRLVSGEIVDPLGGGEDLERGVLRAVSPTSFAEDPLRLVRALRFVSQLGFELDGRTRAQMLEEAPAVGLVSGERIGGGLAADGMGELSKLLLGRGRRGRCASHATRACSWNCCRSSRRDGFDQESRSDLGGHTSSPSCRRPPTRATPRRAARRALPRPRQARVAWRGSRRPLHYYARRVRTAEHEQVGADLAAQAMRRLRYPTPSVTASSRSCATTCSRSARRRAPGAALPGQHGDELAFELVDHKRADYLGKRGSGSEPPPLEDIARLDRFRTTLERELTSPHRLSDLAVDGHDLLELGFRPGPELGRALHDLLQTVVDDPGRTRASSCSPPRAAGRGEPDERERAALGRPARPVRGVVPHGRGELLDPLHAARPDRSRRRRRVRAVARRLHRSARAAPHDVPAGGVAHTAGRLAARARRGAADRHRGERGGGGRALVAAVRRGRAAVRVHARTGAQARPCRNRAGGREARAGRVRRR